MINCIAIDDEPPALELIQDYCSRIDYLNLKKTFTRTSEAVLYLSKFPVDLLFLDIQMPDISGIDFCKSLDNNIQVIFTTAYSEYAVEGFNLDAVDYLLKPIKFSRFEKAVKKTCDYLDYLKNSNHRTDLSVFVRSEYKLYKIPVFDIQYIEGMDNYIRIFTSSQKPVISHMSLKAICEKLPDNIFMRVHRSFVVNVNSNISYSNRYIYIGDKKIPVGVSYEKDIKKYFS